MTAVTRGQTSVSSLELVGLTCDANQYNVQSPLHSPRIDPAQVQRLLVLLHSSP